MRSRHKAASPHDSGAGGLAESAGAGRRLAGVAGVAGVAGGAGPGVPDIIERERALRAAHRRRRPARYRSLLLRWARGWLRPPARASEAPLPTVSPGQVAVTFIGHASVLVRYADMAIVCDPMLGRWVKGVKRAVLPGLAPVDLHEVGMILLTHAHVDHLHRPTLAALPRQATVVVPPRTAQLVSDLGFARVVELAAGESVRDRGVDVATCAVRHGGATPGLSYVIRGDGPSVYFCGDSGYFSGFAEIGERHRPDIAVLPIGGYAPASFRDRHMSPLDALYAYEDLGARVMIPIHHGAFPLSYEQLGDPARWLSELVAERGLEPFVIELEPGQSRVFVPPRQQGMGLRAPTAPAAPVVSESRTDTTDAVEAAASARPARAEPADRTGPAIAATA